MVFDDTVFSYVQKLIQKPDNFENYI